ncbi:MAG: ABC transporter ATP-binding protein [Candidatus Eisenbacteria bacterium]
MPEPSIQAEGIGKRYRLGQYVGNGMYQYRALRERIPAALRAPLDLLGRRASRGKRSEREDVWALKGVSFDVKQGESLGLVGSNGAGKSTLLKILSRITEPTEGRARMRGRVGSLLEVGTGFHPELTGRENVYLSGTILGMSRKDVQMKFDEIVSFAGIDKFVDTPVKRYSSGMWVRLGFAVAVHLEPEILLVDEVLAVGDAVFQRRCLGKMGEVAREGRTVIFVSHNMGAVTRLCRRCIWLDEGELRLCGDTADIVPQYLSSKGGMRAEYSVIDAPAAPHSRGFVLRAVRVKDSAGTVMASIDARHDFSVEIEYGLLKSIPGLRVGFRLLTSDGTVVLSSTDRDGDHWSDPDRASGVYASRCTIPGGFLNTGQYTITLGVDIPTVESILFIDNIVSFDVEIAGDIGGTTSDRRLGVVCPCFPWKVESLGSPASRLDARCEQLS